jgi:hypothetical protein
MPGEPPLEARGADEEGQEHHDQQDQAAHHTLAVNPHSVLEGI